MRKIKNSWKNGFVSAIALLLLTLFLFPSQGFGYEPTLKFKLKPGPYAVGFKTANNYDHSRTFYGTYDNSGNKVNQKARPIQTSIWYPADADKARNAKRMVFKEYAYLMAHELGFKKLTETVKQETLMGFHLFFSTPEARKAGLGMVTNAVRDADAAEGKFPLVVYGASINCVSFENSVFFEHLASHGYIVVSSPCLGTDTRYVKTDLAGTEAQARDILYLLGYMKDFPGVDYTKIAVMGFSWGGMSNMLAAARDTRINAAVCLDGSIAYNKYYDEMITKSLYYKPDKITIPVLFMRSKRIPDEIMKKYGAPVQKSAKFYDLLKYSDAYFIRFNHMMHGDFCSTFLNFMEYKGTDNLESSQQEVNDSYNLMCKYAHTFLDAYIKGDAAALKYMSNPPKENGIADGTIAKQFKKGLKLAPSFGEFISRVREAGFDKIAGVYTEIKKDFPGYTLVEDRLTDLAYDLFPGKDLGKLLPLLKFTVELFPKSSYGYYGLGEIYALTGDKEAAVKALEKSIELNPRSRMAKKKLEELKKSKE
ncbi:MAG: tetratricopeptide repeat protein [bacterium]|nr:tetratricopeptide repeat protein [bacterium]